MNVYMTETEQVEAIKDWWRKYGNTILFTVILTLGAFFTWQWWQRSQVDTRAQASVIYEQMLAAVIDAESKEVKAKANYLLDNYAKTPYGKLAALMLARQAVADGKFAEAEKQLNWVISNAKDRTLKQVARVRLARILLASGQLTQALKVLEVQEDEYFLPLISEVRGDIYLALGERNKARQAYKVALESLPNEQVRPVLKMKLNELAENV